MADGNHEDIWRIPERCFWHLLSNGGGASGNYGCKQPEQGPSEEDPRTGIYNLRESKYEEGNFRMSETNFPANGAHGVKIFLNYLHSAHNSYPN